MPSFVSKGGVWEPALERVVDPNAEPGKEVYEGPDRTAQQMLDANGGSMGVRFDLDPQIVIISRQLGFKSVKEYLEAFGYDQKKADAAYDKAKKVVNTHKDAPRKPSARIAGGGQDTSGQGKHREGGYGEPEELVGKSANAGAAA